MIADSLLIAAAAFLAGGLNSIAGGGTFLTFPALVYIGIPPVAANATSAVAVLPGYASAAWGFRRELNLLDGRRAAALILSSVLGALVGSGLLLVTSNEAFAKIVPYLLLAATLIFLFKARLQRIANGPLAFALKPYGTGGSIVVAAYGGYFNGGLGIVLLALYALWRLQDINEMNGLKNGVSFIVSTVSCLTYIAAGLVVWHAALVMMAASVVGGLVGARLARRLEKATVVRVVVAVGLTMSAIFFYRSYALAR